MPHTVTKYDANILDHHAKSGDALELSRTLDTIAQREAPNGYDRADILLLAKYSQLPRQEWRRLGVSRNTRPPSPTRGSEDPNGFDRVDILLLAKEETGDNVIHSACAFGNTTELLSQFRPVPLDVNRNIQFHEPHPRGKLPFLVALRLGRRLNRAYGWIVDIFTLRPPHFLAKATHLRPHMNGAQHEDGESLAAPAEEVNNNQVRSSFEIMGCVTPNHPTDQLQLVRGVGTNLSRPPSSMPDFGFVGQNDAPPQAVSYDQLGLRLNGAPSCPLALELSRQLIFTYGLRKSEYPVGRS
ncbi:hypothetical protein SLS64_011075 [Diaporthe eres]|uniref:Uncharacterized protein n=1 Tax=Diaporthe eres TaxID=83184 RepID=A0ABR1NZ36_DIAER